MLRVTNDHTATPVSRSRVQDLFINIRSGRGQGWELSSLWSNTAHFRCLTAALTCDSCELEQAYLPHFLIFLPTKSEPINTECWQAPPVTYKYNI